MTTADTIDSHIARLARALDAGNNREALETIGALALRVREILVHIESAEVEMRKRDRFRRQHHRAIDRWLETRGPDERKAFWQRVKAETKSAMALERQAAEWNERQGGEADDMGYATADDGEAA